MSKKDRLLGMPHGTAQNKLRKMLLWQLVVETGNDTCFRCGRPIDSIDDLSIEHKEAWQGASDPKEAFFDLENIAFSHLRCNSSERQRAKTHCSKGHPYDKKNTYYWPNGWRKCRECENNYNRSDKGRCRNERFRQANRDALARKERERQATRRGAGVSSPGP